MSADELKNILGDIPDGAAPGTELVIMAGEKYTMTDKEGQELYIEARDSEVVIEFLQKFDTYVTLRKLEDGIDARLVAATWQELQDLLQAMPGRILTQLPSYSRAGIIVPGHTG